MKNLLPTFDLLKSKLRVIYQLSQEALPHIKRFIIQQPKTFLSLALINFILMTNVTRVGVLPFKTQEASLVPLTIITQKNDSKEVFGFAPYWTLKKTDNIDFSTLTTLAYFDAEILSNGEIDQDGNGYQAFHSKKATELFTKAHDNGTRVVLTITQMQRNQILAFLDNPEAQTKAINLVVDEVQNRGIDGINIDFEMNGDPGAAYREKFTHFVANLTTEMHIQNPNSQVTVSVYAASAKQPKLYDIGGLAQASDGIFMMAYDFANASAAEAWPTAPLYGAKEGKYWYDISTAVDDFLAQMPAEKLILGVPWYGYNYVVSSPEVKAATYRYSTVTQPYTLAQDTIYPDMPNIDGYQEGWDESGQVGWKAYFVPQLGAWRMIFIEDSRSLGIKYDFAKDKGLGGVGIWALGFDEGKSDMWVLLREKFGQKLADASLKDKAILGGYYD